jgi:hypothetical protein
VTNGLALVAAEIVDDDDVAGLEGWHEDLFDVSAEALAIDRPVDDARRIDAIASQSGKEGQGSPAALRRSGNQLTAARRPAAQRRHVGFGPSLVDEDQPRRVKPVLIRLPPRSAPRHIRTKLLRCEQGFF